MLRRVLVLFVAGLFILTNCGKDSNPIESGRPTVDKNDIAGQTHLLVNSYRQSRGLSALRYNNQVAEIALEHSRNMAGGVVPFSHEGFSSRADAIAKQMKLSAAAENVAWNRGYDNPAAQAVNSWLESPGHLANIVGDYNTTGIGVAVNDDGEYYFTQIFVKSY